ncbi:MAG: beta-lactamase family protein [Candidatus Aminicenantes bacterium]|nr:beta-lactamase family protein [Candidatus Aminicenantes bacterium]
MIRLFVLRKKLFLGTGALALVCATAPAMAQELGADDIRGLLEPIRIEYKLPALGGAVITSKGLLAMGAVGVRKAGTDIPVTENDLWHLGSDTKAMTAVLIGSLVEKGLLRWETTVGEIFPKLVKNNPSPLAGVNLLHLLSHRSGLPHDPASGWWLVPRADTIQGRRLNALAMAFKEKPVAAPGERYVYSNFGYVVAGAMAEQVAGSSWEELISAEIFIPLGMQSAGFGGVGTPGEIDQPWGHGANGKAVNGNGPAIDNPPVCGPAARVHCKLADWAKFITDQLRGARGEPALLKPETYRILHTPPFGGDYALGWGVVDHEWGGGKVLTHAGSNMMNYAMVWIAPQKDSAVLVVTNQGGQAAATACDKASAALINRIRGPNHP